MILKKTILRWTALYLLANDFFRTFCSVGIVLVGGLLLASAALYALDVYATSRIDQFLLDYYGPEIYDRYTTTYDQYYQMPKLSATTANQWYGYRSLYGYKILGWLETAYLAYGAAKEVLDSPECQKRFVCELKTRPKEDLSWLGSKLVDIMANSDDENEVFDVGQSEKCQRIYRGCAKLSLYERI